MIKKYLSCGFFGFLCFVCVFLSKDQILKTTSFICVPMIGKQEDDVIGTYPQFTPVFFQKDQTIKCFIKSVNIDLTVIFLNLVKL